MTRRTLLLVLLLALLPFAARAQRGGAEAWRVERGGESVSVRPSRVNGYPALPLSALVSLGAEVSSRGQEVEVTLGGREMRFRVGSSTVTAGEAEHRLEHPVYTHDGVAFLPLEFFTRLLAELKVSGVQVDPAARVIRRVRGAPAAAQAEVETAARPEAAAPRREAPRAVAKRPRPLVVVDAGHGGVDPGARGPGGTREKDVSLAVARRLAALLREDPGLEVRMTRDRDTLIALRDRSRLANLWREGERPALFISIHCNANDSRAARGFETYFLSEAKTEDARRVAQMENAAQKYEGNVELDPLSFILHDLRQNHYLRESNDWAGAIQRELAEVHPGPNRGVKQAGFYVLNGTFMPAVLVELGFITHPREEEMLSDPEHQRQLARGLARSIRAALTSERQASR
jgi:N-acetylmuramoyl-L-alanine amidase